MRYALRPLWLVIILMGFAFPLVSYAQSSDEPAPVLIQGTPELEALVTAVRDAYAAANPDADVQIDTSAGLSGGFDALCRGEADIVMSTEPITDAQITACTDQGQDFIETVMAYEAVVLLVTPEAELTCTDQEVLFGAWQLGSPAEVTWADLGSEEIETPVVFYGPEALNQVSLLFRAFAPAGDLRDDIIVSETVDILAKVQEAGSSAFGFMSLADLTDLDSEEALVPLAIKNADLNCIVPSLETLADRTYPLARTDYLYVNADSMSRDEVAALLEFALMDDTGLRAIAPEQGLTAASAEVYQASADNLTDGKVGRTFTRPASPVSIATTAEGTLVLAGTSVLKDLTTPIQSAFSSKFASAQITADWMGNTAGWQAFCAGEADVLQTTRDATDEEKALCAENGVEPYTVELGFEALVVAVPAGNDWIECMDAELAAKLFHAGTEETPALTKWNEINADWPDADILLVVPLYKTGETDYLILTLIGDLTFAFRADAQLEKQDALYRAQGIANTDNGITYLWWSDFQDSSADVKLLEIDAGAGCVAPSPETFADGTYALAFPVRYHFSRASFDNALVRAFLWHFFDEDSLATLAKYPFAGLNVEQLGGDEREAVFQMLADYEAQAAEQPAETVEPTTEPTAEPTPESTPEPTVEPTASGS